MELFDIADSFSLLSELRGYGATRLMDIRLSDYRVMVLCGITECFFGLKLEWQRCKAELC